MFSFAIITTLYAYALFFLGIGSLLYRGNVAVLTILYSLLLLFFLKHDTPWKQWIERVLRIGEGSGIALILLSILVLVNTVGVLGPETAFDALWYHLVLPKLYLQEHTISFFSGGLLYYSAMPKLGELLFIPALVFGNEIGAKAIQFLFGLLTALVIYKISRLYFSLFLSLLVSLVFYSNIVVSWESTVAYVDLIRAFFETMALYAFLLWYKKEKQKYLLLSAVMVGAAISTKLLALGSLPIFLPLLVYKTMHDKKKSMQALLVNVFTYAIVTLLIPLPWFVFSYSNTGSVLYPFFTNTYPVQFPNSIGSIDYIVRSFLFAADPISPIYIIVLPLLIIYRKNFSFPIKLICLYSLLAILLWYMTPQTGGGRFLLPYLPAFSILVVAVLDQVKKQKILYKALVACIFTLAVITIGYRGIANARYIHVIFGQETKEEYLTNHLNFSFGDFYDTDNYFKTAIKPADRVLLYGFHNLYYVQFPFIDSSWVQKGDTFTHIAVQNTTLPKRFKGWDLMYENSKTGVKLYNKDGKVWEY